jgi:hypothetical protein
LGVARSAAAPETSASAAAAAPEAAAVLPESGAARSAAGACAQGSLGHGGGEDAGHGRPCRVRGENQEERMLADVSGERVDEQRERGSEKPCLLAFCPCS